VLELGIALHSVLIGVALGVAGTPAAAKPLAAALVFHQSFEGFALGSAIAEAGHEGWALSSGHTLQLYSAQDTPPAVVLVYGQPVKGRPVLNPKP